MRKFHFIFAMCILSLPKTTSFAAELPNVFFRVYCFDCHAGDTTEGSVDLESHLKIESQNWSDPSTSHQWEKVLAAIEDRRMPPPDAGQPPEQQRKAVTQQIHSVLKKNVHPGGTVLRRLNRFEYENTVREILKVPYIAPPSFPADVEVHGFDNIGEGLILSPPLMEQYFLAATEIADLVIPPVREQVDVKPETVVLHPKDFSVNFEGSKVQDKAGGKVMRLVTKNEVLVRSSTWPTRFEATHSGEYTLTIDASAFKPVDDKPLTLRLLAFQSTKGSFTSVYELKELGELEIRPRETPSNLAINVELEKGETIGFYWANSSFGWDRDGKAEATKQLRERLSDRPMYAAWLKMGFDRGRTPASGWDQMKRLIQSGKLDLQDPKLDILPEKFTASEQNQLMWLFEYMHHEVGPGLDIHSVKVTGPNRLIDDRAAIEQRKRTESFLGNRNDRTDREYATKILTTFLNKAFRRPATTDQIEMFVNIALSHQAEGHRFEDGIHLAIRAALCSPNFLYRESSVGELDDYDLASRLSYFLWTNPPDNALQKAAAKGELSRPDVLAQHTERLLKDRRSSRFLNRFLDQWLDLKLLPEIMPDPRLMRFSPKHLQAVTSETRSFVGEILRKNLPLETFINPDFTYLNARNAALYGIKNVKGDKMRRIAIKKNGRFGGILGQASVMMATANGVDTQPVLRGVWLLENVFGNVPPPPPSSVPAIEPDTSGATSIRELLSRHKADIKCAQCHRHIDPLGFALENFDPIGRWRSHYPVYEKNENGKVVTRDGLKVDAKGELPDGTKIATVTDLKRYLVKNIDQFSACLTEKLLVYATGRRLNYGDRQVVQEIVSEVAENGNGFRDLIIAIVQSESFQAK